jgi:predicted metal-dependent enzyme (double-stranded beta helix superfamily)
MSTVVVTGQPQRRNSGPKTHSRQRSEIPIVSITVISKFGQRPSPSLGQSSRAVHPANQLQPTSTDGASDDDSSGALTFEALHAIASGLAQVEAPIPLGEDDPSTPRSVRLLATASYDVWLITWPDGSGLEPHDHGGVRSVLHVVGGELVEIVADYVDGQPPRARMLRQGDTVRAKPSFVHDLANRSGADATTLHVYSPPLSEISFFNLHTDTECERLRTTAVVDQEPQASSNDSARSRPHSLVVI